MVFFVILLPAAQVVETRILNRLEEIGWRKEAEIMIEDYGRDSFTNHKLVRQPRKLSDHGANAPALCDICLNQYL